MNKRKILALVTAMAMLIGVNVPAMAAEEVTPYVIGSSSTAISTTQGGSIMLNCDTSSSIIPDNTKVTIWTNTGHNSQRWYLDTKTISGRSLLRPLGNGTMALNCMRGGEYQCNIRNQSVNSKTPEDMDIHITYNDKNKPSFRMWVSGRPGYNAAYVTRRGSTSGSACDWKYAAPGSIWYYRAG